MALSLNSSSLQSLLNSSVMKDLLGTITGYYSQAGAAAKAAAEQEAAKSRKRMFDYYSARGVVGGPYQEAMSDFESAHNTRLANIGGQYGLAEAQLRAGLLPTLLNLLSRDSERESSASRYNQAMGAASASNIQEALDRPGFKGYSRADLVGEEAASFAPGMPEWYTGKAMPSIKGTGYRGFDKDYYLSTQSPSGGKTAGAKTKEAF